MADWDIVHDWGFPLRFWQLRATLLYPRPTYFVAIALNALLRCSWSITISPGFFGVDNLGRQNGLWLSSLTATGEVFRRFLWTLIRIENAHASSARPMLPDVAARDANNNNRTVSADTAANKTAPYFEPLYISPDSSHWAFAAVRALAPDAAALAARVRAWQPSDYDAEAFKKKVFGRAKRDLAQAACDPRWGQALEWWASEDGKKTGGYKNFIMREAVGKGGRSARLATQAKMFVKYSNSRASVK